MSIVQERSFKSGRNVVTDRYTNDEENSIEEAKEWFLETLKNATVLSVEHKKDDTTATIDSLNRVRPTLRIGKETLTITFIPDGAVPDFKMTRKKERADRKAVKALVREESHAAQ